MAHSGSEPPGAGLAAARIVGLSLKGCDGPEGTAWRELDRLLADRRISVKGIAAAGPSAVLAAVLAHGLTIGGSQGGRAALAIFRIRAAAAVQAAPPRPSPVVGPAATAAIRIFDLLDRDASPYGIGRPREHPMKPVLEEMIDFAALRSAGAVHLHVSASEVHTGRNRIFTGEDLGLPAVLASTSIPLFHPAVEIDGEHYWQGGDAAWPELHALLRQSFGGDVIVVGTPAAGVRQTERARSSSVRV